MQPCLLSGEACHRGHCKMPGKPDIQIAFSNSFVLKPLPVLTIIPYFLPSVTNIYNSDWHNYIPIKYDPSPEPAQPWRQANHIFENHANARLPSQIRSLRKISSESRNFIAIVYTYFKINSIFYPVSVTKFRSGWWIHPIFILWGFLGRNMFKHASHRKQIISLN